jgi:protein ImuB
MAALPHPVLPAGSLPQENTAFRYRQADSLWIALQLPDHGADPGALEALAQWAESLTPVVVWWPDQGLLLEVRGSLRYFSGLQSVRRRLDAELGQRGWAHRLATAPTPLAAAWLARAGGSDLTACAGLAGALGRLPLAATAWPESVQRMLLQMGVRSIADCLRLPRAGLARRIGRTWLDELDRALGKKPDPRTAWRPPVQLRRSVEFPLETSDAACFAAALTEMTASLETELRRRQAQLGSVTLSFRHLRASATLTRIRFVDPVHEQDRILGPMLVRIERLALAEPAVALALETSKLLPLAAAMPELLPAMPGDEAAAGRHGAVPEFALVERLRGRFGARSVCGIGIVAEHRPEHAWCRRVDRPGHDSRPEQPACPAQGRPLWLLPAPRRRPAQVMRTDSQGACPPTGIGSCLDPVFTERIESGWWDGQDGRRDYHVVVGAAGEKLWLYRECRSQEWYLHGIFG